MSIAVNYLYLIISGVLFGGVIFGGKILTNYGLSWLELLTIPNLMICALFLFPLCREFKAVSKIKKTTISLYMASITVIQIGQFTPLFMGVSVSMVAIFLYTQPLWTILINKFILKNKLKLYEDIVAGLVLLGMVVLINPFEDFSVSILGSILAVCGGVGLAVWVIAGTSMARAEISKASVMFIGSFAASVPFFIAYPLLDKMLLDKSLLDFSLNFSSEVWMVIIAYVLLAQLISLWLFYKGAEKVPSIHSGLILLLEPLFAVLLDVVFLDTKLTANIIIGGAIIIGANAYLVLKNSVEEDAAELVPAI